MILSYLIKSKAPPTKKHHKLFVEKMNQINYRDRLVLPGANSGFEFGRPKVLTRFTDIKIVLTA